MTQVDNSDAPQDDYEEMPGGPGAPIPVSQLVVRVPIGPCPFITSAHTSKGLAGLTDRDIKLVVEGGFHTVESIAYT